MSNQVEFRIRNENPERRVVDVHMEMRHDGIDFMAGDYIIAALMNDGKLLLPASIPTPGIQTDADGRIICNPPLGVSREAVLKEVLAELYNPLCPPLGDLLRTMIAECNQ